MGGYGIHGYCRERSRRIGLSETIIHPGGVLNYILNSLSAEAGKGRIVPALAPGRQYRHAYHYRDQLGNLRLAFSDLNNNGMAEVGDILQEAHYYPYGLGFSGMATVSNGVPSRYTFNGKEAQEAFGMQWIDFGGRMYDAQVGRWMAVDGMAEKTISSSPYLFVEANSINRFDPDGNSGEATITENKITVRSNLYFYGNITPEQAQQLAHSIQSRWNEGNPTYNRNGIEYSVEFQIQGLAITEAEAVMLASQNESEANNFIRIESGEPGSRSFMRDFSNSGLGVWSDDLIKSTTAAHEYGHGLGYFNPENPSEEQAHDNQDQRGEGVPSLMSARGKIVDPQYQYNPQAAPGAAGGVMNPATRKVNQNDISRIFDSLEILPNTTISLGIYENKILDKQGRQIR